jgi:hypothetical protein
MPLPMGNPKSAALLVWTCFVAVLKSASEQEFVEGLNACSCAGHGRATRRRAIPKIAVRTEHSLHR